MLESSNDRKRIDATHACECLHLFPKSSAGFKPADERLLALGKIDTSQDPRCPDG